MKKAIKVPYTEVPAELYVYDEIERMNKDIQLVMIGDDRSELDYLLSMIPELPLQQES